MPTDESKLVKWTSATGGLSTPCPTIIGNRQSEAIEVLLQRLDTYIHKVSQVRQRDYWDDDYTHRLEWQWPKRTTRIALLESGRHFLIAVQFFLLFLLRREPISESRERQNPPRDTPVSSEANA